MLFSQTSGSWHVKHVGVFTESLLLLVLDTTLSLIEYKCRADGLSAGMPWKYLKYEGMQIEVNRSYVLKCR